MRETYQRVPLGELADLRMGGTPSRIEPSYWADGQSGLPWVAISDIQDKYLDLTSETITHEGVRAARLRPVMPGTPIMSFKLSLGRATIPSIPVFTNEAIVSLTAKPGRADARWLYHAVPIVAKGAVSETAIKGKTLNLEKLGDLQIPAPALLGEQCRIADILDSVDEQIHVMEMQISKLRDVARGVNSDLLGWVSGGDPLPEWSMRELDHLTDGSPICYGILQSGPHVPGGVPVIMIRDLGSSFHSLNRTSFAIDAAYARSRVSAGDVLVSIKATIGRTAVVPQGFEGNISRDLARIRVSRECDPEFLCWLLATEEMQRRLWDSVVGSTRAEVSIGTLKKIKVPIPDRSEQERILRIVREGRAALSCLESEQDKLRQIKQALMDDLLTGHVRVAGAPV